jgi:hypothetical protein
MPINIHINQFISSLNAHEKQYLSKKSALFNKTKENKYMEMLNLISKHPELSDKELREMLPGKCTPNNYAVAKKYLLSYSCEMLTDYYKQSENEIALLREIEILIMLIRKGQYELSLKLWRNLTKRAKRQENYPVLLHLRELFQHLNLYYQTDFSAKEMQDTLEEFRYIEQQYEQYQQLKNIYNTVTIMRKQSNFRLRKEEVRELQQLLKKMDRFPNIAGDAHFLYNHYYRFTLGSILYLLGNLDLAYPILKENINHWQRNYQRVKRDNPNYLEAIYLYNYVAIIHNEYEDVYAVLGSMANEQISGPHNKAFFAFIQYIALNRIYNRTAQYERVEMLLPVMEESIREHEDYLLIEYKRVMLISMGIAYFATGKLADAYNKIFIVRSYFQDKSRKDQVSFLYLFILVVAFEMDDEIIFRNEHNNTYQYFYAREKPEEFEKEIISALNRAFGQNRKKQEAIFTELLSKIEEHQNNPIQQQVFQIFNFPNWIESRIQGISYRNLREKMVGKNPAKNNVIRQTPATTPA